MPAVVVFTGDIIPIRRFVPMPKGMTTLCAMLAGADHAIGNFEIPLIEEGVPVEKLMNIKGDPALAQDLRCLGLDVVTLANNHVPDYGIDGIRQTRRLVEAQGIGTIGVGEDYAEATRPSVRMASGLRIGTIAFSCLTPTGMTADRDRPGLAAIRVDTSYQIDPWYQMEEPGDPSVVKIRTQARSDDLARACEAVAAARHECDFLIVSIHWGFGSGDDLAEYQWPLGCALIEAGADIVHGHHPHAIHPIGFHQGKPILFGLGTFIGQQVLLPASDQARAMWRTMSPDGVLARITASEATVAEVELIPHTLDDDRLPELAEPNHAKAIAHRLARLSAPFGARVRLDEDAGAIRVSPSPPGCRGCANIECIKPTSQ